MQGQNTIVDSIKSRVDKALDPSSDEKEVLVTIFPYDISRKLIRCLCPGKWLHSQVVNSYITLLKNIHDSRVYSNKKKIHFFNSWFYTKLTLCGYKYSNEISRWTNNIGYTLSECDLAFVSIHIDNHWSLVVIDFENYTIKYLDSLHFEKREVTGHFIRYIIDETIAKN